MQPRRFPLLFATMLTLAIAGPAAAQDNAETQPPTRGHAQRAHSPQSIDRKLAQLTKDLELTKDQQQQVRPLLQEHYDKIQALLDKNPSSSRQELAPRIHAISEETHHKIHALLTDHQKELENAMRQHGHHGEEDKGSSPPAPPSQDPDSLNA